MRKAFLLDTNVILFDSQALLKFGDNDVIIPIAAIEEIDRFKRDLSENGRNARQFSRLVDKLRQAGDLQKGVELETGGTLTVALGGLYEKTLLPPGMQQDTADNRMLAFALSFKDANKKKKLTFITKDTNLRLKADALGIEASDYEPSTKRLEEMFSGFTVIQLSGEQIDVFYSEKKLSYEEPGILPNQYVVLRDEGNESHTALGRYDYAQKALVSVIRPQEGIWGIYPKNVEQSFAVDALLNDNFKLVTLVGKAGTGKTLLAIAAGLSKTIDEGFYQRLLVSRPIFPLGRDIGFLPGDVNEKLNPWMQPIFDNIDFLFGASGVKHRRRGYEELVNQGLLNIEPLTYIRGRSIPQQFMIVDEAQNLSPHEIKTIITRAGEGTKIILTGDCYQIDNPYVDSTNNGLSYVVERFKEQEIAAHITLVKGERSQLSELASNLL